MFSDVSSPNPLSYLHYYISYIVLAMLIILTFRIFTNEDIEKIFRVVVPGFIILISPPLIDLALTFGEGFNISYIMPEIHTDVFIRYLTFFGDFQKCGASPGIRIEIIMALMGSLAYLNYKKVRPFYNWLAILIIYSIIFWWGASPFCIKFLMNSIGLTYRFSDLGLIRYYLLLILISGCFMSYMINKNYFFAFIKDIRFLRVMHFELMLLLGMILALKTRFNVQFSEEYFYCLIFLPACILFAIAFSIITNNIQDYEIDKISNRERPHVTSEIDITNYQKLATPFLFFALAYSAAISYMAFFLTLLFIGNYYIYSMPPLRAKRVPVLSKLTISINSLAVVMMGFNAITGNFLKFPRIIYPIFFIGFTLAANFIDIKDYEGDKNVNIKTLPVIMGLRQSKLIIGVLFTLTYACVALLIIKNAVLQTAFFLLGIAQFYFIRKEKYNENCVFFIYLLSVITIIFYIWQK